MELKQLLSDERAVSPVIGVILMVAITVILAAVIGTFVLGLGSSVQQTTPQATFEINSTQLDTGGAASDSDALITHSTGASIGASQLSFAGDINTGGDGTWGANDPSSADSTVSAGDSANVTANSDSGTIRVIWNSEEGDNSATLQSWDYT